VPKDEQDISNAAKAALKPTTLASLIPTTLPKIVEAILTDVFKAAKEFAAEQWMVYTESKRIASLVDKLASIRLVKTIWQLDREVDLEEFYHPTALDFSSSYGYPHTTIRNLNDFNSLGYPRTSMVFVGIAGQGKSIFLRHLACQELIKGEKIPLFIELRRLTNPSNNTPLTNAIESKLLDLGFTAIPGLFRAFAERGSMILMLDAFDELDPTCVKHVLNELHSLIQRFPLLQIIATSRPNSDLCVCPEFRVYRLADTSVKDTLAIAARLVDDSAFLENLKSGLDATPDIHGILITPLMSTLLVINFRAHGAIPPTVAAFYEDLVPLLLSRHDKTKPGFIRPKRCGLNDHKIREVFETFSFLSKRKAIDLSTRSVHDLVAKSIELRGLKADECAFIDDIVRVTCLLIDEGTQYYFLHKSVQEFCAASFTRRLSEESCRKFYNSILEHGASHWQVELQFLKVLDTDRFERFFWEPACAALLFPKNHDEQDDAGNRNVDMPTFLANFEVSVNHDRSSPFEFKIAKRVAPLLSLGLNSTRIIDFCNTLINDLLLQQSSSKLKIDLDKGFTYRVSTLFHKNYLSNTSIEHATSAAQSVLEELRSVREKILLRKIADREIIGD
jgi:hypothetical protein